MTEAWIVYKEYHDCVMFYAGTDLNCYNTFTCNPAGAEQMTLARARKMAEILGGKYRKI